MGGALIGSFGRSELGTEVVTIGRAPTNKLTISDGQVSGRHAEVRPEGAGYVLVDVGSTNGTLLNGVKIPAQAPQPLRGGDVITIGSFQITVELAIGELPATIRATPAGEGAYAPTERVATPPGGGGGGGGYAGTAYVPPPPPPPDFAPFPPGGAGFPPAPAPYPESVNQYAGSGPGGAAPYYPDPFASAAPPPPYAPPAPGYAPPYAGPPGVALGAPAGTPANSRKLLLIVGGILAAVIILGGIVGIVSYANSHSPAGVTKSYYSDIQDQKYGDAYQFLTGTLQAGFDQQARQLQLSNGQELFTRLFSCWDTEYGNVTAFSTRELSNDDTNALVRVDVTRSQAGQYSDQVKLQKISGDWKVADFGLLQCK
jgi:hypothetical protein